MSKYKNEKLNKTQVLECQEMVDNLDLYSQRDLRRILNTTLEKAETLDDKKGILHIFSFSKISEKSFNEAIQNDEKLYEFCTKQGI